MEEREREVLYILRGLSGSGKSTLAKALVENTQGVVLSTDDFFIDPETGTYNYNQSGLNKAHIWNQERALLAMEQGVTPIVIDNTNLNAWEPQAYVLAANLHGYHVQIREPDTSWKGDPEQLAKRSKHGLSAEFIAKMMEKSENYNINDILRATPPASFSTHTIKREREKIHKKLVSESRSNPGNSENSVPIQKNSGTNLRVEFTKNDGQKAIFKPVLVKPGMEFETVKKQACNTHKLRYTKGARVFTLKGEEIFEISDLEPNQQFCISNLGTNFIPMALKQTAEERRGVRQQQQQQKLEISKEKQQKFFVAKRIGNLPLGISEIIPDFLFLGSGRDAHSAEELQKWKITHVLNVSDWHKNPHLPDHVVYVEFPMNDDPREILSEFFPKIFPFLETVRIHGGHVLVHCAVGKSRSPSIVMAYLMKHFELPLKIAYDRVRKSRPKICPNSGFFRQLIRLDAELFGKISLHWDDIETDTSSIVGWLRENHRENIPTTHLWWEVISKKKYSVPSEKFIEFFSECAKAFSRGEQLKIVEVAGPIHKLYLDIDIKLDSEDDTLTNSVEEFLFPEISRVISEFSFPEISGTTKFSFPENSGTKEPYFVVTGVGTHFTNFTQPHVLYKWGYHVIWPEILVDGGTHRKFVLTLIDQFKVLEKLVIGRNLEGFWYFGGSRDFFFMNPGIIPGFS